MTKNALKPKIKKANASNQTFVTFSKSHWKDVIVPCYEKIVIEKGTVVEGTV